MKLTIQSKRDGYRRAGLAFSASEATVIDTKDFTDEQVESIQSDANLIVVEGEKAAASSDAKELKVEKVKLAEERKQIDADRKELEDARAALQKDLAAFAEEKKAFEAAQKDKSAKATGGNK